ncbi:hypothetical protein VNO77_01019 [Canavalia gladiata]|uniref:GATA-type domain-containing protein n=1 Tax=Canavalia gladiata TaxID=3824 RepID=A0AAN9R9V7_CANGL
MVSQDTLLWPNGSEDKPVLCNECGSRYRIWGSHENYLPKHFEHEHLNNLQNLECRISTLNVKSESSNYDPDSGVKNTCFWQPKIPSKKRSRVVYKKITPMKRFQRQLLNMWKHHGKPNEFKDVLFFDNMNNFIPINEIGLGVVLLKPNGSA